MCVAPRTLRVEPAPASRTNGWIAGIVLSIVDLPRSCAGTRRKVGPSRGATTPRAAWNPPGFPTIAAWTRLATSRNARVGLTIGAAIRRRNRVALRRQILPLRRIRPSGLATHDVGIPLEIQRPALIAIDAVAHACPAFAVPLQVPVLDLHAGPLRCLG